MSEILYDHYKETCSIASDAIKRRDRLLIYVVVMLALLVFLGILPEASGAALNNFLGYKFGVTTSIDLSIIGSTAWFLLLLFVLRYFQTSIFVERQYPYIHHLEEKIENGLITREGKAYLNGYPIFSDWMWLLYTIVFPTLLLLTVLLKIGSEIRFACLNEWTYATGFNFVVCILVIVSVSLYLVSLHTKKGP